MESSLVDSIIHVCSVLNKHAVQYMIVGGTAVALHGYFRRSINTSGVETEKPDLDIWYNPTYENYFKLLNALEESGKDVSLLKEEQVPNPKSSFFKYEFDQFTLDLLPELQSKMKFNKSFAKKDVVFINKVSISFVNLDDLLFDKNISARPKDKKDIEELERVRRSES